MGLAHRPAQRPFRLRDRDQVDVIGHQAVRPNLHALFAAPVGHQFAVSRVVPMVEERPLSAVPALGYVVGQPRND